MVVVSWRPSSAVSLRLPTLPWRPSRPPFVVFWAFFQIIVQRYSVGSHYTLWRRLLPKRLFYFGEDWLRGRFAALFPTSNGELAAAAWLGHLQHDQRPVGELMDLLHPYYALHLKSLGRSDAPTGYEESGNRLTEYLMIF